MQAVHDILKLALDYYWKFMFEKTDWGVILTLVTFYFALSALKTLRRRRVVYQQVGNAEREPEEEQEPALPAPAPPPAPVARSRAERLLDD